MRKAVKRYYGARHWRYITCSCFQRRAGLGRARAGGLFLRIVDEVPRRYRLVVVACVVRPEHFHLLMSEPEVGDPSKALQVLK